jgi:hypothetical protein
MMGLDETDGVWLFLWRFNDILFVAENNLPEILGIV